MTTAENGVLTTYEAIAARYDELGANPHIGTTVSLYARLIETYGNGGRRLLDAGCGTGLSTIAFRDAGWSVTGYDLAPSMVNIARARAVDIPFSVGDLRRPDVTLGRFDAITCVGEPMCHLAGDDEFLAALVGAAGMLDRAGVLVFDLNTLNYYRRMTKPDISDRGDRFITRIGEPVHVNQDEPVAVEYNSFQRVNDVWRRTAIRQHYQHRSATTVRRLAGTAGLRVLGKHGITPDGNALDSHGDERRHDSILYVLAGSDGP